MILLHLITLCSLTAARDGVSYKGMPTCQGGTNSCPNWFYCDTNNYLCDSCTECNVPRTLKDQQECGDEEPILCINDNGRTITCAPLAVVSNSSCSAACNPVLVAHGSPLGTRCTTTCNGDMDIRCIWNGKAAVWTALPTWLSTETFTTTNSRRPTSGTTEKKNTTQSPLENATVSEDTTEHQPGLIVGAVVGILVAVFSLALVVFVMRRYRPRWLLKITCLCHQAPTRPVPVPLCTVQPPRTPMEHEEDEEDGSGEISVFNVADGMVDGSGTYHNSTTTRTMSRDFTGTIVNPGTIVNHNQFLNISPSDARRVPVEHCPSGDFESHSNDSRYLQHSSSELRCGPVENSFSGEFVSECYNRHQDHPLPSCPFDQDTPVKSRFPGRRESRDSPQLDLVSLVSDCDNEWN